MNRYKIGGVLYNSRALFYFSEGNKLKTQPDHGAHLFDINSLFTRYKLGIYSLQTRSIGSKKQRPYADN
jgi:hypothetical protein